MLKTIFQLRELLVVKMILIFLISINLYASNGSVLKGTWVLKEYTEDKKTEPYHLLNLSLDIKDNNQIDGSFEYFFRWFSRIEDQKVFTSTLSNDIFEFSFNSDFGGRNGIIQIKINDDCSLNWNIIKEPNGEYYAPRKVNISPSKLEINKYCKKQHTILRKSKQIHPLKQTLYSSPSKKTKMYLIKGDKVEILEEKDDWLYILYKGKKDIKAWIPKSAVQEKEIKQPVNNLKNKTTPKVKQNTSKIEAIKKEEKTFFTKLLELFGSSISTKNIMQS